jgi:transaldolase
MSKGYFHRVHEQSPTRFWINNPTMEEARKAVAAGAFACTTNPTFAMKMHQSPTEKAVVDGIVDEASGKAPNKVEAAAMVQRALVARVAEVFFPLFQQFRGKAGFVSIQINPHEEDNPESIVRDAHENLKIAPNIILKIPVTEAGLVAIRVLAAENLPIIATEVMALAQAVAVCRLYQELRSHHKNDAPLFVTHITGILDEHLKDYAEIHHLTVGKDLLFQAGCALARRQYAVMTQRHYPGIMLGGGARGLHHFTEMVGGNVHVTINWKGAAETLIADAPPVVWRIYNPVPQYVIKTLEATLPDFAKACCEDRLAPPEFAAFGPVTRFRNMFIEGWDYLAHLTGQRRKAYGK